MDNGSRGRRSRLARVAAALVAMLAASLTVATSASAEFDVTSFSFSATTPQAGAHADVTLSVDLSSIDLLGFPYPEESLRELQLELPPGLIGNAADMPACPRSALTENWGTDSCPMETQVGIAETRHFLPFFPLTGGVLRLPIWNIVPGPGEPALLAIAAPQPILISFGVRSGQDYGLTATSRSIPQLAVLGMDITLWGVPADPSHDAERGSCGVSIDPADLCPIGIERKPFMVNPTDCTQEAGAKLRLRSYEQPDRWIERTAPQPKPTGCDQLSFEPHISVTPQNPVVDQPTATRVTLGIRQNEDPDGLGSPALRDVIVRMPKGMTINPSVAHDRTACSDGAFAINSGAAAACPAGSKIGTIGLDVPALRDPLPGDVYLAEPKPGAPFRLFLYAESQGVRVKLQGDILPDPETGRITAVFSNNPQVPFRTFNLSFLGGDRAVLLMPRECGTTQVEATFTPYSSSNGTFAASAMRTVGDAEGGPCPDPRPFGPTFEAGVTNDRAGEDTGFTVAFGRPDGHQILSRLKLHLSAGLLGRLAAFPLCPNDRANVGTCSEDSMVGGTIVSAGSGKSPLNVAGRVFITEPPKPGQIAGLSIVVPAIVGPYDLGTVVVRAGITVNPDTSLTVEADPLPTMLSGIELRIKQVIVNMDRPGFMFNPTDCSPKTITGSLVSTEGAEVGVASPFSVRGCADMPLAGKVAISTTAPVQDGGTTGLTFNLGGLPGHSNVRQVQVVLPSGMGARLDGPLQTPCTESDFAADACRESARVGVAKATTPVLSEALSGKVYFIENPRGNALPRLGIRLKGALTLDVIGDVEVTRGGRVATTFPAVPDVPITEFVLDLDEGENAVLSAAGLCGKTNLANVDVIGHTGKLVRERVPVKVDGCRGASSAKSKAKTGKKSKKKGTGRKS